MKKLLVALFAVAWMAAMLPEDAGAARLGGGRSFGAQRSIVTPLRPAAPVQQQRLQPQQGAQPAPAAPAQPGNRWLGPLAGLAAGLGLGWLLGQGGFGGMIGSMLLVAILAFAVMALARMFMRPRAESAQPLQYAGLGNETVAAPPPSQLPAADTGAAAVEARLALPPGFDADGFLRQAKLNFLKLQAANDRRDFDAIRDMTSDEMYDLLKSDILSRGPRAQTTDVTGLDASLLEVATEGDAHWVSLRFWGSLSEEQGEAPKPFEEVWHLTRPTRGDSGWLLAGIQQVS